MLIVPNEHFVKLYVLVLFLTGNSVVIVW